MTLISIVVILVQVLITCSQESTFRFANNYGSNMVLQRAPLNAVLWGFGEEGQRVVISTNASNEVYHAKVNKGSS